VPALILNPCACFKIATMATKLDLPPAEQRSDFAEVAVTIVAGLAFAVIILFIFVTPFSGKQAAARDFVSYWATGHQLVHHRNPYDRDAIYALEHTAGLGAGIDPRTVLIMRNPPWALPIAYPLGFLGLRFAGILWTLLLLACLLVSIRVVRELHGSPPNRIHWLGFGFTPAVICLTMGQTSLLALLGLVLFLRFYRCHPFNAGAALWLCALKPHLFLPFAAVLALWIVLARAYKLLAGFAVALASTSAVAFLIDPTAWPDYIRLMRSPSVENQFIPCLADVFRHQLDPHAVWLQYLPAALACLWALVHFWRRRAHWDWLTGSSSLILVSLVAAPYSWLYDQCLAIPALLDAAYATRSRKLLAALALLILAADLEICFVKVTSSLFLWTAPAWFAWFLLARALAAKQPTLATPASAPIAST
jgi:Glycosyltransferase family 87